MDHPASIIHTHSYLQLRRDFDKYAGEISIDTFALQKSRHRRFFFSSPSFFFFFFNG